MAESCGIYAGLSELGLLARLTGLRWLGLLSRVVAGAGKNEKLSGPAKSAHGRLGMKVLIPQLGFA